MRSFGYKYAVKLPDEKIEQVNIVYRKFTTLINCIMGVEILLYIYLFVFPYYLKLLQMPFFVMALILCAIPLVMLYLTYIAVNYLYYNFLLLAFITISRNFKFNSGKSVRIFIATI